MQLIPCCLGLGNHFVHSAFGHVGFLQHYHILPAPCGRGKAMKETMHVAHGELHLLSCLYRGGGRARRRCFPNSGSVVRVVVVVVASAVVTVVVVLGVVVVVVVVLWSA